MAMCESHRAVLLQAGIASPGFYIFLTSQKCTCVCACACVCELSFIKSSEIVKTTIVRGADPWELTLGALFCRKAEDSIIKCYFVLIE